MSALTDSIDVRLAAWWPQIVTVQDNFFAAHGHYWQGRRTHTQTPADGNELAPDRADEVADELSWNQMATLPATMLSAHEFNVMQAGQLFGYSLVSEVIESGVLKRRVQGRDNSGKESDTGWQEVPN